MIGWVAQVFRLGGETRGTLKAYAHPNQSA